MSNYFKCIADDGDQGCAFGVCERCYKENMCLHCQHIDTVTCNSCENKVKCVSVTNLFSDNAEPCSEDWI
jgi:hypothetical protein